MEKNNSPKVEITANLTKTIENAYDDGVKKTLKSSSGIVSTVLDFFHNTVMYPMQKYNLYAENKLNDYALHLQEETQKIPDKFLINPKVNILGPVFDGLKYNLDEEYIKEMFTNILISDMDIRKQNKVLPSYIEVVKQLSRDDAMFLKELKDERLIKDLPIIKFKEVDNKNKYFNYVTSSIICLPDNKFKEIPPIVLDNLLRLQIIDIPHDQYIANITLYNDIFNMLKETEPLLKFNNLENKHLDIDKMKLEFTQYGKNFIDICLS